MKKRRYKARTQGTLFRQLPPSRIFVLTAKVVITLIAIHFTILFVQTFSQINAEKVEPTKSTPTPFVEFSEKPSADIPKIVQTSGEAQVVAKVKNEAECASEIDNFLATYPGTPWVGYGQKFVDATKAVQPKVNQDSDWCDAAKLMVAIGCVESSCGKNHYYFNFAGLKYYRDPSRFEQFNDWDHAINTVAYRIYRPYLQHGSEVFAEELAVGTYCQSSCITYKDQLNNFLSRM